MTFGKGVFADVIIGFVMRATWINWLGPKFNANTDSTEHWGVIQVRTEAETKVTLWWVGKCLEPPGVGSAFSGSVIQPHPLVLDFWPPHLWEKSLPVVLSLPVCYRNPRKRPSCPMYIHKDVFLPQSTWKSRLSTLTSSALSCKQKKLNDANTKIGWMGVPSKAGCFLRLAPALRQPAPVISKLSQRANVKIKLESLLS